MPEDRHSGVPGGGGSGANVKSGVIAGVTDGDIGTVVFNTPFAAIPEISLTLDSLVFGVVDIVRTYSQTTTQFQWELTKGHGGSAHTHDIHWIATDAGDP